MISFHHRNPVNLLYVCRQIYSETAPLPYKLNSFVIDTYNSRSIVTFLKRRTPAQIELMMDVTRRPDKRCYWASYKRMSAAEWIVCLRTQWDPAAQYWFD